MNSGLDIEKLAEDRLGSKEIDVLEGEKEKKKKFSLDMEIKMPKFSMKKEKAIKVKDVKFISADIGSKFIKIVEGKKKKDKIQIFNATKVQSSQEFVKNGDLVNLPMIVDLLGDGFLEMSKKTKDLVFVIGGSQIISREVSVIYNPEISRNEFKILIAGELEQYLPISMDEYDLQYKEIERFEVDEEPRIKVLAIVCPKLVVKEYLSLSKDIGMKKKAFALDISGNTIEKLYSNIYRINDLPIGMDEAVMFIDMGASALNISILNAGKLVFLRSIQGGGTEIDRNISLRIGMHIDEAERLKIDKCNLISDNDYEFNICTREVVATWLDDIERILNFHSSKTNKRIKKIYLYGGTSRLTGLTEYMRRRLNIDVIKVMDIDNLEIGKSVNIDNIDEYLNIIGGLIRL